MKEKRVLTSSNCDTWTNAEKNHVLRNMEKVLSEILSDKYDAKITITLKKYPEEDTPEEE